MDFGLVLQNIPPVWQVIDYARRAEIAGFDNVWCFDSHLLWQESNVIFSQMLSHGKEQTLLAYQEKIIPVINPRGDTRT